MKTANFAERMGAVAFSLGLGVAVATGGTGIASADSVNSTGAADSPSADPADESGGSQTPAVAESASTEAGDSSSEDQSAEVDDDDAVADKTLDDELAEEGAAAPKEDDVETDAEVSPVEEREDPEPESPVAVVVEDEKPGGSGQENGVPAEQEPGDAHRAQSRPDLTAPMAADDSESAAVEDPAVEPPAAVAGEPVIVEPVDDIASAASAAETAATAGTVAQRAVGPVTGFVKRLLALIGVTSPPAAIKLPSGPSVPAVLIGMLDWVRREVDRVFFNDAPVPDARQIVQEATTGVVLGTFNSTDDEKDRLTFELVNGPKYGDVVVYSNGTYIYTPKADAPSIDTGWTDTFSVRVVDQGFSLRKVTEFLTGRRSGTVVQVGVTVSPPGDPGAVEMSDAQLMSAAQTITLGFNVINASSKTVKLASYGDHLQNQVTQSPPVGATLAPGESHHFEVVYYFLGLGQVNPVYTAVDGQGDWKVYMSSDGFNTRGASCKSSNAVCTPGSFAGSENIVLMDQPGGVIEIPAGQGQKQAEALNRLCGGSAPASCSFNAKSQTQTYGKQREIWSYATQESKADIKDTAKFTNTTSHSIEISASAGVNIKKIVSLEIAAKYAAKFEDRVENTKTIEFTVPPWTHKIQVAEPPVLRYTGDFTVKMGNTTYLLRDVYFDVPDPDRAVRYREISTPVPH